MVLMGSNGHSDSLSSVQLGVIRLLRTSVGVFAAGVALTACTQPASAPPGPAAVTSTSAPAPAPTSTSVPAAAPTSALTTPLAVAPTGTVLLVPGYGGSTAGLRTLQATLREAGRRTKIVGIGSGEQSFVNQALKLEAAVKAEERAGRGPVDIVGHSNGGVLTRYWVRKYGGAPRVGQVISLGSPQHGTQLAGIAVSVAPERCTAACRQVVPGSSFLRALNAGDESPAGVRWLNAYTDDDDVVTPPASARLRGGINVRLQTLCAGAFIDHIGLLSDPLALGLVVDQLATVTPRAPDASDCSRLRQLGS